MARGHNPEAPENIWGCSPCNGHFSIDLLNISFTISGCLVMFLINELVFYGENVLKPEELPGCTMSPVDLRKTSLENNETTE